LPSANGAGPHSIEWLNLTSNGSARDHAERAGKTSRLLCCNGRDVGASWCRALPDVEPPVLETPECEKTPAQSIQVKIWTFDST